MKIDVPQGAYQQCTGNRGMQMNHERRCMHRLKEEQEMVRDSFGLSGCMQGLRANNLARDE
jgi:hypothetical protein